VEIFKSRYYQPRIKEHAYPSKDDDQGLRLRNALEGAVTLGHHFDGRDQRETVHLATRHLHVSMRLLYSTALAPASQ